MSVADQPVTQPVPARGVFRRLGRPRSWQLFALPRLVVGYVFAVIVADLGLTGWGVAVTPVRGGDLALFAALSFSSALTAQANVAADRMSPNPDKPLPSPAQHAQVNFAPSPAAIDISYNSPSIRGRKIMGGLVPYGQPWRTGANPATSFVTTGNLKIGSLSVPAGKYTLFTLPGAPGTPWKLIISKKTGEWGIPYPEGADLGRTEMHLAKLPTPQESMSITFEHTEKRSTYLHVKWETTDVSVKIEAVK